MHAPRAPGVPVSLHRFSSLQPANCALRRRYTVEFGVVRERGDVKAFGAGEDPGSLGCVGFLHRAPASKASLACHDDHERVLRL